MPTKVGILYGGPSSEYEASLGSAKLVRESLPEKYSVKDIFISKKGEWHDSGIEKSPEKILSHVDVVFNALHGEYGEDGQVQKILESHGIPFTGSRSLESALAMHKPTAKEILLKHGIKTPKHFVISSVEDVEGIFRKILLPIVVKPVSRGSSVHLFLIQSFDDLIEIVQKLLEEYRSVLVEEYISGKEVSCGVVDNFREKDVYPFLPIEIVLPNGKMFDYNAKYSGKTHYKCPSSLSKIDSQRIQDLACLVHKKLGLRHYSRSDFIIHPKRGVYFLEANSLPGLTENSLYPKTVSAVGSSMPEFLDHVLRQALQKS